MEQCFGTLFRQSAFSSMHPSQVISSRPLRAPWTAAAIAAKKTKEQMIAFTAATEPVSKSETTATANTVESLPHANTNITTKSTDKLPILHSATQWGLKYSLRTDLKTIQLDSFDDETLIRPIFKSGFARHNGILSWKENFPQPQASMLADVRSRAMCDLDHDITGLPAKPLQNMTNAEWKQWLLFARSKRSEFNRLLENRRTSDSHWKQFLGLENLPSKEEDIHPVHYSAYKPPQSMSDTASYTTTPIPLAKKVRGRLLNVLRVSDYAVGINGVVAYLHKTKTPSYLQQHSGHSGFNQRVLVDRSVTYDFWVLYSGHDHLGRPDVIVTMMDPAIHHNAMFDHSSGRGSSSTSRYREAHERQHQNTKDLKNTLNIKPFGLNLEQKDYTQFQTSSFSTEQDNDLIASIINNATSLKK
ncbi:hypothetical protein BATDEDRAFT_85072 [Batrachochytrium dendrobatidis JAM81]|uniref:Uncharacterized protein n=2 Tax=Batrachochytrium dendrobatidis TaxID=109871 RepID=F4NTM8_BATDJ|nr:uncharacterized protein BATDEDRAFT_85072 [Batrachochytrium dendrobatidis JAM81]EGF83531.1 hypothetical protein BATDEDRAFT_85072 [Batrachochytrium dendrobatidis JAM81]KAJ8327177.1 hypothetical protein O5D80_004586 [Batrachochytrium dendrobatidis]KAK5667920.1 hypothetical protein QVD99_004971 [Batrachochytrium dendrobatidis]OAJ37271.1 hypothetical protein BDEG_21313 [Batrachochytrium dendrobatidis JEL423]|eukprot:XP_006676130.1 hypothetical protein BATDEDRAFT_85072 [Batrachochytrium dendrobatidis JAM81]